MRGDPMQSRMGAASTDGKPYRPNVGIALFNASGEVLIGHHRVIGVRSDLDTRRSRPGHSASPVLDLVGDGHGLTGRGRIGRHRHCA